MTERRFFLFNKKLQITHLTIFFWKYYSLKISFDKSSEIKLDFSIMNSFSMNIFEWIKKLISLVSYHC